jgi:hypothetical protein
METININTITINSSILGEISQNIILVDSNPARIESVETVKVKSQIRQIKTHMIYELSSKYLNPNSDISNSLTLDLILKLKSKESTDIKYFNRGLIKNLLGRNPKIILDNLNNCDWIITSNKVLDELSKLDNFKLIDKSISGVLSSGKINNISFYITDQIDENDIIIGNSDSITAIINKNIVFDVDLVSIEFLFIDNGVRRLTLK